MKSIFPHHLQTYKSATDAKKKLVMLAQKIKDKNASIDAGRISWNEGSPTVCCTSGKSAVLKLYCILHKLLPGTNRYDLVYRDTVGWLQGHHSQTLNGLYLNIFWTWLLCHTGSSYTVTIVSKIACWFEPQWTGIFQVLTSTFCPCFKSWAWGSGTSFTRSCKQHTDFIFCVRIQMPDFVACGVHWLYVTPASTCRAIVYLPLNDRSIPIDGIGIQLYP